MAHFIWWRFNAGDPPTRADSIRDATQTIQALLDTTDADMPMSVARLVEEHGDCWLKWPRCPLADDPRLALQLDRAEVTFSDLIIRNPGEHPGGRSWWIDLPGSIYNPVLEEV